MYKTKTMQNANRGASENVNRKKIMLLHIICPIAAGALIYCMVSPDVIFIKKTADFIGWTCMPVLWTECTFLRHVRNYLPDMLWGYSLVISLFCIIGNNAADVRKVFGLVVPFTVAMEIMQKTPFMPGTFDVFDIFAEVLAETIAAFIIHKLYQEEL